MFVYVPCGREASTGVGAIPGSIGPFASAGMIAGADSFFGVGFGWVFSTGTLNRNIEACSFMLSIISLNIVPDSRRYSMSGSF